MFQEVFDCFFVKEKMHEKNRENIYKILEILQLNRIEFEILTQNNSPDLEITNASFKIGRLGLLDR